MRCISFNCVLPYMKRLFCSYAVKCIDMRRMRQKEREDSVNEIRLLSSVRHANLIRCFEAFLQSDGLLCIVTDFADNGDLEAKLNRRKATKYVQSFCSHGTVCREHALIVGGMWVKVSGNIGDCGNDCL